MSFGGEYTDFGDADVEWIDSSGKNHKWKLVWASNSKKNYEALANYCSILNKLQNSLVKQALSQYFNILLGEFETKFKVSAGKLDYAETIIAFLCGDKTAKQTSSATFNKVFPGEDAQEKVINFIKKVVPGGKELLSIANVVYQAAQKREEFEMALVDYASMMTNIIGLSKTYDNFKTKYDSISKYGSKILKKFEWGSKILEKFVPSSSWIERFYSE